MKVKGYMYPQMKKPVGMLLWNKKKKLAYLEKMRAKLDMLKLSTIWESCSL
jgi:hypothetical protein